MNTKKEFLKTANLLLNEYIKIKKGKVLIIKDHESKIVEALEEACAQNKLDHKTVSITINRKPSSPIPEVLEEMLLADVIIAPTRNSTTHSPETNIAKSKGKFVLTLPMITDELFLKIGKGNLKEIELLNNKIGEFMKGKEKVTITTKTGTNISFSIKGRPWELSGGITKEKPVVNAPTGESFCAPIEVTANGIIFIDYWRKVITPKKKAWIEVRNGNIVSHSSSAEPYIKELSVPGGMTIAEFGIGTNKAHKKPIGNILHDEKIYGTCHIAFGMNLGFGGKNSSTVHSDVILIKPKIVIDGKTLKI